MTRLTDQESDGKQPVKGNKPENQAVRALRAPLEDSLRALLNRDGLIVRVFDHCGLTYMHGILRYEHGKAIAAEPQPYSVDLLIADATSSECWTPRVVIECKLGYFDTHGIIAYNEKAARHKQVHPCLRYGILICDWGEYSMPPRIANHGRDFDFAMLLAGREPSSDELGQLTRLLAEQVEESRRWEQFLSGKKIDKKRYRVIRRRHTLEE